MIGGAVAPSPGVDVAAAVAPSPGGDVAVAVAEAADDAAALAGIGPAAVGAIPKRRSMSPEKPTITNKTTSTEASSKQIPPHVAKSLEQMMSMGFANDGNWLEQLLLAKDGNISMALDAINPSKPSSGHGHH